MPFELVALLFAAPAHAEEAEVSPVYMWVGVGTTAAYVPNAGPASGPLGDISPSLAVGYFLSETVSVELSAGMTFLVDGGYALTGLGPSIVWAATPNVYLAGRVFVPVHPDVNVIVMPSAGITQVFGSVAPFLELGVGSAVGRGEPDLAIAPSAGITYLF
ncbi:MAG: hypothetical protein ABMB14_19070 [Myxococcota bacterium]